MSILTLALSHIINLRGSKQRGQDGGAIVKCFAGGGDVSIKEEEPTTMPPLTPFQKKSKRGKLMAAGEVIEGTKRHLVAKSSQSPSDAAVKSMSSVVTPQALDHICEAESPPMDDFASEENELDAETNSSSCHASACEGLGKGLIAALLYEDLKDREDQRKMCDRPSMNTGTCYCVHIMPM